MTNVNSHDRLGQEEMNFSKCFAIREKVGGRDRVRTCDPLLAKQVLSQLSYTPTRCNQYYSQQFTASSATGPTSSFGPFGPTAAFSNGSSKPKPTFSTTCLRNSTSYFNLE